MSLAIHKGMLRGFIQSMHDEGIINDQFWQLQARRPVNQPDYVVRTITSYCVSAQTLFSQLTGLVDQESVNFHQINVSARELYEKSSSIGAEHVKLSCGELLRALAEHDKDHCSKSLYWTKNEFSHLRRKFETVVQLPSLMITIQYFPYHARGLKFDQLLLISVGSSEGSCWQGGGPALFELPLRAVVCPYHVIPRLLPDAPCCHLQFILRFKPHTEAEMALSILKGLLQEYVQSLFDEGILNDQFSQIQTLKSVEEPEHVVQLIDTYFIDVETILSELTTYIDYPDLDFSKLATLAHKVEERSLSIGAEHVRLACADLIQACNQTNEENLSKALIWIRNEFAHTRNKLEAYVQMERRIIRLKSRQQN